MWSSICSVRSSPCNSVGKNLVLKTMKETSKERRRRHLPWQSQLSHPSPPQVDWSGSSAPNCGLANALSQLSRLLMFLARPQQLSPWKPTFLLSPSRFGSNRFWFYFLCRKFRELVLDLFPTGIHSCKLELPYDWQIFLYFFDTHRKISNLCVNLKKKLTKNMKTHIQFDISKSS